MVPLIFWGRLRITPSTLAAFAFVSWAAVSLLWSPDWKDGLDQLIKLGLMLGLFLFVQSAEIKVWGYVVSAALLGAIGLDYFMPMTHGAMGNQNFFAEFVILCLPFTVMSRFTWPAGVAGIVYLFAFNDSNLRWLVVAAVALWGLIWLARRKAYFSAMVAFLVPVDAALAWGVNVRDILYSISSRAEIWISSGALWLDHPVIGTGFGGFNFYHDAYREKFYGLFPNLLTAMGSPVMFAGEAHNEILQTLAELGLVGLALALAFLWFVWKERKSGYGVAVLALGAVLSLIGFPAHNPGTAVILVIALGMVCRGGKEVRLTKWRLLAVPSLAGGILFWLAHYFPGAQAYGVTYFILDRMNSVPRVVEYRFMYFNK